MIKEITWVGSESKPISKYTGILNNITVFEICQFKNDMFCDPYLMTSRIVPGEMIKSDSLDELKKLAQEKLEKFIDELLD